MSGQIISYFTKLLKGIYASFQISLFKDELQLREFIETPLQEHYRYKVDKWLASGRCAPSISTTVDNQFVDNFIRDPVTRKPRLEMDAASAALVRHFEIEEHILMQVKLRAMLDAFKTGVQRLIQACREAVRKFENALPAIASRIKSDPQWRECKSVKDQASKLVMDNLKSRIGLDKIQQVTPALLGDIGLDYNSLMEAGPGLVRQLISDTAQAELPRLTPEVCGNISQFEATFRLFQGALQEIQDAKEQETAEVQKKLGDTQMMLEPHLHNLVQWKAEWSPGVKNGQVLTALRKMKAAADYKAYATGDDLLRNFVSRIIL